MRSSAVRKGADINHKDFAGRSILSIFGADARLIEAPGPARDRVKQLFALGADPALGGYALVDAAAYGMATAVEELLAGGVDPNFQQKITNVTALHRAVKRGHVAIVKALLAAGARSDLPDERKKTALQLADGEVRSLLAGSGATSAPTAKPPKIAPAAKSSKPARSVSAKPAKVAKGVKDAKPGKTSDPRKRAKPAKARTPR